METIQTQSEAFLANLQSRRRHPVAIATLTAYQSRLKSHILPAMGNTSLAEVDNKALKAFVASLSEKRLSAPTITGIVGLIKLIVSSAVDSNGNEKYPRKWNHDFIDLPIVNPAVQDAPILGLKALQKALQTTISQDKGLYALLAGSGARIGEIESLMVGQDDGLMSFWNPSLKTLVIRTTAVNGRIQAHPKTSAGNREIDLSTELNNFLIETLKPETGLLFKNREGNPMRRATAYEHLEQSGIKDGFHSFRRFRITHLEKVGVPRGLQMYWTGHAARDVHETYIKIGKDIQARKDWAEKAGLGFEL